MLVWSLCLVHAFAPQPNPPLSCCSSDWLSSAGTTTTCGTATARTTKTCRTAPCSRCAPTGCCCCFPSCRRRGPAPPTSFACQAAHGGELQHSSSCLSPDPPTCAAAAPSPPILPHHTSPTRPPARLQNLFAVARRFYLLFQHHTNDAFNATAKEFLGSNDGRCAGRYLRTWQAPQRTVPVAG